MPNILHAESTHYEGENIRTLGRVVSLTQVMLSPDGAGPLTIRILSRGKQVYAKTLPIEANGILNSPAHPNEWDLSGDVNFDYVWDAAGLAAESPSWRFKGGRSYTIWYDHDTELSGHVLGEHRVRILPAP